ncbi:hypothetical protein [Sphingobacterium athyrii]|uniref:Uncharacterized protein n=1 Tax=Sphingobacterium athyrii TaxID=2152717 RepID=A0A363NV60_9SPHI|nr:hypothetical protein [Sphingobacterium athyrii]PUV24541.1 hypothetical protein DCO56_14460 [Sphingobacterium athyrii]
MKDNTQQNGYAPAQFKMNLGYIENILYKYHKISEALNSQKPPDSYPTFMEEVERISEDNDAQISILRDIVTNQFVKFDSDNNPTQVLEIINLDNLNSTERIAVQTLAGIVYQYCIHDYQYYFARHVGENMSDKGANDHDEIFLKRAYDLLKDLKNLLLFREEGFDNNKITIDKTEQRDIGQGKMKSYLVKENQVEIQDPSIMRKISDILIDELLDDILHIPNAYIDSLKFTAFTAESISYRFVNQEFEKIRPVVEKETKGKQPSKKAVFKGLISKLVRQYVKDEKLTFNEKELDERESQLLAYMLLSWFGFISLDLVNSHKDRDSRIKYMESLPEWIDAPILPNRMNLISKEGLLKNYTHS